MNYNKAPEELAADEEFRNYVDENVNLNYILRYAPEGQVPTWLKEWNR